MDSLATMLEPYKEIVAQVTGFVTIAQFFSGGFVCKDIYKKGSTKGFNSMPFIGGLAMGILALKYGLLLNDSTTITVNIAAVILNTLYVIFYAKMTDDLNKDVLKPSAVAVALVAGLLGYTEFENPDLIEFRFGLILTVLMLCLIASPLGDLKDILAKKDASSIPFPITFMATIVTFSWLIYGIILRNEFLVFQNVIALMLCVVQLYLIFKYPGQADATGRSKKRKNPAKSKQS